MAASSFIELVFALGLAATVAAAAVPYARASLDDVHARGAARYLASRLQAARMDATIRNRAVALRVSRGTDGTHATFSLVADGNRNGVLARDIAAGVDRPITAAEAIRTQFPGADFGALPGLPAVDASGTPPGSDPVRLGSGDMAVFTPIGTATAGSLYIKGRGGAQYVVRIFGETGRTRVLKFNPGDRSWIPLHEG